VNFTTIDYRTFDADAARVVTGATGTFRDEFTAQSAQLKTLVNQNRSVTKGSVLSAALVSHDSDSARVLLVVDAAVTNTSATSPVPRHYRIQLDLARSGSTWRTDQLEFIG
jgi:Mce-associated membrane protein